MAAAIFAACAGERGRVLPMVRLRFHELIISWTISSLLAERSMGGMLFYSLYCVILLTVLSKRQGPPTLGEGALDGERGDQLPAQRGPPRTFFHLACWR